MQEPSSTPRAARRRSALTWALGVLFVSLVLPACAPAASGVLGTSVSIIGAVTSEKDSFVVRPDGVREPLRGGGWEHLTG